MTDEQFGQGEKLLEVMCEALVRMRADVSWMRRLVEDHYVKPACEWCAHQTRERSQGIHCAWCDLRRCDTPWAARCDDFELHRGRYTTRGGDHDPA